MAVRIAVRITGEDPVGSAVQVLRGHSSIATTERYTAVDDEEIRAAAEMAIFIVDCWAGRGWTLIRVHDHVRGWNHGAR